MSSCDVRLPDGVNQRPGTAEEVREAFKGWDPTINRLLDFVSDVLEWRVSLDLLFNTDDRLTYRSCILTIQSQHGPILQVK